MVNSSSWTNDQRFQWQLENLRGAIKLAEFTIQSLLLINGGAAIGVLSLVGNVLAGKPSTTSIGVHTLTDTMFNFGLGVACALGAAIFAYIAQRTTAVLHIVWLELIFFGLGLLSAIGSAVFFVAGIMNGAMALP